MTKRRVLVLCTGNAARSQMAEGLVRALSDGALDVVSAGIRPTRVHPMAIQAMQERGIEIRHHRSKSVGEFSGESFDYVITVCDDAAEACPTFPGPAQRIHWSLPDPAAATGSEDERLVIFRRVRDALEARLREWIAALPSDGRERRQLPASDMLSTSNAAASASDSTESHRTRGPETI